MNPNDANADHLTQCRTNYLPARLTTQPPAQDVESILASVPLPHEYAYSNERPSQKLWNDEDMRDYAKAAITTALDAQAHTVANLNASIVTLENNLGIVSMRADKAEAERDSLRQQLAQVKAELDAAKKLTSEASIKHVIETKAQR